MSISVKERKEWRDDAMLAITAPFPQGVGSDSQKVLRLLEALEEAEAHRQDSEEWSLVAVEVAKKAEAQRGVLAAILVKEVGCPDDVSELSVDCCGLKFDSNGEPLGCSNDEPGECWLKYAAQEAAKQKGGD
jgi:hypothetical protein